MTGTIPTAGVDRREKLVRSPSHRGNVGDWIYAGQPYSVVAVASHDTASMGVPLPLANKHSAYLSSGAHGR